jgi:trehalose 6-phosphate phosphatase
MKPLAPAWESIAARAAGAKAVAVGLDFDGTLTPLRDRPEDVVLAPSTRAVLRRLAALPGVAVAVASGRALADLEARLAVPGMILVGNHGCERRIPGGPVRLAVDGAGLDAVRAAARELAAVAASVPGAWLEDKGPTLAVHHRRVGPERREGLRAAVRDAVARCAAPLRLSEGRCVFDVRPAGDAVTKGTALREAFAEAGVPGDAMAWYVGDDATDEEVFAGLPPDAVTIHVGGDRDPSAARFAVAGPGEVVSRLEALVAARAGPGGGSGPA